MDYHTPMLRKEIEFMPKSNEPGSAPPGFIPLCAPEIRGNEWKYVKECLDSSWVSTVGSYVERFERDVAAYADAEYAVAAVNGTSALHVSLLVAGVQPDDEVLVSTLTFIAPANAIRYAGAWPVFMDAEPAHWQMDVQKVNDFLERECQGVNGELRNRWTGRRVKAIVPVHVLGHPVDLDPLLALARRFDLRVIEDATESLGARYKGHRVGALGDIGCFSFNGNKIITTGGGGMIVTRNKEWAAKLKYLTTQAKDDPIEYVHHEIGFNYRLTNIQAAMGCAQMEVLDEYIAAKRAIAAGYDSEFAKVPGLAPMRQAAWAESICWMYTMRVDAAHYGEDSRALLRRLGELKIQARPLWQPCHMSPAHQPAQAYHCDVAEELYRTAISLPCSVGLTPEQQKRVVDAVMKQS